MNDCKHGWSLDEIKQKFGMDDMSVCNRCENLVYEDCMVKCKILDKEYSNEN